jgi:hypothetical protein
VILQVRPLRFEFHALDPISFPPGQAANMFRGAFGEIFRRIACQADCPGARTCPRAHQCSYARLFEPRADVETSPSGFGDRPRPFVLRAALLDGRRYETGQNFSLDVNVFDPEINALRCFTDAFERLCIEGLGRGRPRIQLVAATELPLIEADLAVRRTEPVRRIKVSFLTATALKIDGQTLREPRFDALAKRTRDRVASLIGLYQNPVDSGAPGVVPGTAGVVPGTVDFRGMGDRAAAVRMIAARIEQVEYERRSGRTGQRHSLGGFIGEAEYEGDLAEFLPWLHAAWWTGVGRLTVWGNGMLKAEIMPPSATPVEVETDGGIY